MPKHSEASEGERAAYVEGALATKRALFAAIRLLQSRQAISIDPAENAQIGVAITSHKADILKVQSRLDAFLTEQSSIRPPSEQQLAAIKQMATDIDRMTANAVLANDIVKVTTALAKQWGSFG